MLERVSDDNNITFRLTGKQTECINLASYNYLGFSKLSSDNLIGFEKVIRQYGIGTAPMHELGEFYFKNHENLNLLDLFQGSNEKIIQLERTIASFLGVQDVIVFGMGFATNSFNIPALIGFGNDHQPLVARETLVISDSHVHASIRSGIYISGASFVTFKHNGKSGALMFAADSLFACRSGRFGEHTASMHREWNNFELRHEQTMAQNNNHRGRSVQHGGHHTKPAEIDRFEAQIQILFVRRRGSQHWCYRAERTRHCRLFWV